MIKQKDHDNSSAHLEFDTFPNIAELFDLFPYVMYLNRTVELDGNMFNEFKYSYPLGQQSSTSKDSELLAYFHRDNMALDRISLRANSLNITNPLSLYAS